jgi:hypothetical protein
VAAHNHNSHNKLPSHIRSQLARHHSRTAHSSNNHNNPSSHPACSLLDTTHDPYTTTVYVPTPPLTPYHPANVAHSFKRYRRANVAAEEPGALSPSEADHADAPLWDIEDFTDFNLVLFWGIVGLLAG